MRLIKAGFALMIASGLCLPVLAQSQRIQSGNASTGKFTFYYETHLDPANPNMAADVAGGVTTSEGVIHRYLLDSVRNVYFGYDVSVEVLPQANTYRVTFSQLTMTPDMLERVTRRGNWNPLPTPGWGLQPGTRTVRADEVLSLNLMTNGWTGQKIVDYVSVGDARGGPGFRMSNTFREPAYDTERARDFHVEDTLLTLRGPRLSINGKADSSTTALNAEVTGPIVWFHAPNRGRFLLSLTPQTEFGFRKAGEIRGPNLTFTVGNDTYNLVTGTRIAPGDSAYNLYVLHEPAWRPAPPSNDSSFVLGAADRADVLIQRKE